MNGIFLTMMLLAMSASALAFSRQSKVGFPNSVHLDAATVQEAIAWGETGDPQPYWLFPKPGKREPTAAVYTPYIRVALLAQVWRRRGERLSINQIPDWIKQPEVHVVVRPSVSSALAINFPEDPRLSATPIAQIALARRDRPMFVEYIRPLWMTVDLSYLDAIGGKPFSDAAGAAAFTAAEMASNVDVYGWWQRDNRFFPSHGFLDAEAMKGWR
jgi:hypothetical protein